MDSIRIRGARTHNLKNVNLDLPRQRLVVITGLSGSGKSSLAFDTLYAEGQRRYVESLSAYARQFLQLMDKPDVDLIEGLSPSISIEQKATSHNPRSTVGTVTEIHDYLRLLFARAGDPQCPEHGITLAAQSVSQMVDQALSLPADTRLMILSPLIVGRKGEQHDLIEDLRAQGFVRVRVDGEVHELDAMPKLAKNKKHTVEVVVDRLKVRPDAKQRLAESFETALRHSDGRALAVEMDSGREHIFSARFACPVCGYSLPELEPRLFSFNNPMGACPRCDGLGQVSFFDPKRVIAFPNLSLASGAVKGWDRRNQFYFQMLQALAQHYGFDLDAPFESLPARIQDILLHGSGREKIRFAYSGERGGRHTREHPFEGILTNLERRYKETDSPVVREELAKYLNTQTCPECARHAPAPGSAPRVRGRPHDLWPEPAAADAGAGDSGGVGAVRRKARDRREDRARDPRPPAVLEQRRPGLSHARPLRGDALGRRGPAHPPGQPDRLGADRRDVRAGRALHRPAPARQRPLAVHPEAFARSGQLGDRGRARPGRHPSRRLRGGHGPRRGRARRTDRGDRHAAADRPPSRTRSPANTCRASARSRSRPCGIRRSPIGRSRSWARAQTT